METEQAQNSKFIKEPTIEDEEQKEKKATVEKILGDRLKKKEVWKYRSCSHRNRMEHPLKNLNIM